MTVPFYYHRLEPFTKMGLGTESYAKLAELDKQIPILINCQSGSPYPPLSAWFPLESEEVINLLVSIVGKIWMNFQIEPTMLKKMYPSIIVHNIELLPYSVSNEALDGGDDKYWKISIGLGSFYIAQPAQDTQHNIIFIGKKDELTSLLQLCNKYSRAYVPSIAVTVPLEFIMVH